MIILCPFSPLLLWVCEGPGLHGGWGFSEWVVCAVLAEARVHFQAEVCYLDAVAGWVLGFFHLTMFLQVIMEQRSAVSNRPLALGAHWRWQSTATWHPETQLPTSRQHWQGRGNLAVEGRCLRLPSRHASDLLHKT